jgi:ribose 1,5-bisphosphokinase PhnN
VTPAEIEQAVARTSAQYMGVLRTMLAEVGKVYEGQIAAQQETIAELRRQRDEDREREREALAELRRRAEVAEAEFDVVRLRLAEVGVPAVVVAGQETTEAAHATETNPAAHRPAQGLWRRLRRVWRGR